MAAAEIELSATDRERLSAAAPLGAAAGDRYLEADARHRAVAPAAPADSSAGPLPKPLWSGLGHLDRKPGVWLLPQPL